MPLSLGPRHLGSPTTRCREQTPSAKEQRARELSNSIANLESCFEMASLWRKTGDGVDWTTPALLAHRSVAGHILLILFKPMADLKPSPTRKHYRIGDKDDYVVLDGARVIGRIFRQPQASEGRPWFWTITAHDIPPSLDKRGYSPTREEAMAVFFGCQVSASSRGSKPSGRAQGNVRFTPESGHVQCN